MNKVEIIEFVKNKLLAQGCKSMGWVEEKDMDDCKYRSENGKCAVGHLIPDNLYHPSMESVFPSDVEYFLEHDKFYYDDESNFKENPFRLLPFVHAIETTVGRKLDQDDWALLYKLQRIHDTSNVEEWEEKFNKLKIQYI